VLDAVAIQKRVFSGPHSDVMGGLGTAAEILAARGKAVEAEAKLREALEMGRVIYSADSTALAMTIANLAGYVQRQGRLDEAAEIHRRALRLFTARAGTRDVSTAIVMTNLAWNAYLRKQLAEAEPLYRQALPVLDSAWQGASSIAQTLVDFSQVLFERGNCAEADPHVRRVIAFQLKDAPPGYVLDTRARRILGNCLVNTGRFAEAEPNLTTAHQTLLSGWGPANPFTQALARELVNLYERWGKPAEAQRYRSTPN
jgi:ATP/maltotriose-dependent transcriptional regulator MalT